MKKYFRIDLNFFRLSTTDFRKNDFTRISQYWTTMPTDNSHVVGKFCVGKSMIELENSIEDDLHWRFPFIFSNFVLSIVSNFMQAQLYQPSEKMKGQRSIAFESGPQIWWLQSTMPRTLIGRLPAVNCPKNQWRRYILKGWKIFKRNCSAIILTPNLLNYILFYCSVLIEHTK